MNIIFDAVSLLVLILFIITKKRFVNAQDGKKYAYVELLIDMMKILAVAVISIWSNHLCGQDINVGGFVIDLFMLVVYLLPLLQKNYNYEERKALAGIWSFCICMVPMVITMFQMIIGAYDSKDAMLVSCFLKGFVYFLGSVWYCFTVGSEGLWQSVKSFFKGMGNAFNDYEPSILDYYTIAFLGLFLFTGMNGYFLPVGAFGLHEIIAKKKEKGVFFICLGNFCLLLKYKIPVWGEVAAIGYIFVALADMLIHFIKQKKKD